MQLDAKTTALVLIDLQKGVLAMPVVPHPSPTLYERATEFAGVESTARSAWEHGYDLVLCEDLCADLSAESHASSFKNIFPRLAHIVQSPEITLA